MRVSALLACSGGCLTCQRHKRSKPHGCSLPVPHMLVRNLQGHIFIDRDPKHFALILNFLRDGFAVLPRDEQALTEIMVEAAHYKARCTLSSAIAS